MVDVGKRLRRAREARRMSLDDVERMTGIPRRHLLAMEEENFHRLPSPMYVRSYLRTYAGAVGEDPHVLLRSLRTRPRTGASRAASAALPRQQRTGEGARRPIQDLAPSTSPPRSSYPAQEERRPAAPAPLHPRPHPVAQEGREYGQALPPEYPSMSPPAARVVYARRVRRMEEESIPRERWGVATQGLREEEREKEVVRPPSPRRRAQGDPIPEKQYGRSYRWMLILSGILLMVCIIVYILYRINRL